ncbi:T9SS type A sorting domain-containing protein [Winogradskyella helgolandensis]|uniref:T9SS type A sorting domain-containing protein n=1 Tax=Winogradskyella helgolandensis TaxID=2697010 RepID=UPI0015C8DEB4|nr:T9SS type A sorting domain-containing protein [Winogradskyella helgolandensis]
MKIKLLLVLVITCTLSFAQQIPENIKPPSWSQNNVSDLTPFKLPTFDLKALQDEDLINDQNKSKPWRFGHDIYVDHNFNDVGEWTTLENGDRIWRMAYSSKGAYSLNFMFDVFKIPEGAKLYVYNKEKTDLLRPFTYHNNNPEEVLGTWLVEGSVAYIEYYQPANVVGEAKITLGSVVHGYRTAESYQKSLNDSGSCNQDVDCDITPASDPYEINTRKEEVKKAVAMLVSGGGFCSGTLVNNTNNDETPYFLTANHCSGGEGSWAFRFNWRSPNPSCGTTTNSTNGSYNQTVSGSVVRANSSKSDMELVEITDTSFFNNNPDVVWAGWNNSTTETPAMSFGIHHPSGDIQKVSRNDEGAIRFTTSFNGNTTAQMWRINDWELGVTEGGSSGSGLFNETGHLIGMLSAGTAACSGTVDNGGYDIYGRFGVAWDFGTTASTRLSDWLDPSNSGAEMVDQYPSLQTYNNDARASAGSGNVVELCGADFTPQVTLINSGDLPLTSADISYFIDAETSTPISWTGNLLSGESVVVDTPTYSNLGSGSHSFTINVSNPNGIADENISNDTFAFNFEVSPTFATTTITFDLLTDNYGEETSWTLVNSSGIVVSSGPIFPYDDATSYQEIITIPTYNECYTFTIFDDENDGVCCFYGDGSYSLNDENENEIISGGEFSGQESVTFSVQDPLSVNEFSIENLISLYPNPVNHNLNIDLNNLNEDVSFEIFDTLGKKISKGNLRSNETHTMNISHYQSGIYFIKLSTSTTSITKKLIKN